MNAKKWRFAIVLAVQLFFYLAICLTLYKYHGAGRRWHLHQGFDEAISLTKTNNELQKEKLKILITSILTYNKNELASLLPHLGITYFAQNENGQIHTLFQLFELPFPKEIYTKKDSQLFFINKQQMYFIYNLHINGQDFIICSHASKTFWKNWAQSLKAYITIVERVKTNASQILYSTLEKDAQQEFLKQYEIRELTAQDGFFNHQKQFSLPILLLKHPDIMQVMVLTFPVNYYLLVDSFAIVMLMLVSFTSSIFILLWAFYKD